MNHEGISPGPPADVIRLAEQVASSRPPGRCVKSLRGAVLFDQATLEIVGVGFNSPPAPLGCTRTARCREVCRYVCMHAEERAMDQAMIRLGRVSAQLELPPPGLYSNQDWRLDLVHVKLGDEGRVVPSGPPSCSQCSKRILDSGIVVGVWLYEMSAVTDPMPPVVDAALDGRPAASWRYYPALEFHLRSLAAEGHGDLASRVEVLT